jgi:hypothetical protein
MTSTVDSDLSLAIQQSVGWQQQKAAGHVGTDFER